MGHCSVAHRIRLPGCCLGQEAFLEALGRILFDEFAPEVGTIAYDRGFLKALGRILFDEFVPEVGAIAYDRGLV